MDEKYLPMEAEFQRYSVKELLKLYDPETLNNYPQFRQMDEGKPCFLLQVQDYAKEIQQMDVVTGFDASLNDGKLFV